MQLSPQGDHQREGAGGQAEVRVKEQGGQGQLEGPSRMQGGRQEQVRGQVGGRRGAVTLGHHNVKAATPWVALTEVSLGIFTVLSHLTLTTHQQ